MPYCCTTYKSSLTFADHVLHYDNNVCVQTSWLSIAKTVTYARLILLQDLITSVLDDWGLIGDNLEDILSIVQCSDEFIATVLCMHDSPK